MLKFNWSKFTNLVVCVRMVGDSKDRNDIMFAQQTDQRGYGWVILMDGFFVIPSWIQVAALVVAFQDARQHIGTVRFIMKGWLGGENQQMCAVTAPTDLILQLEFTSQLMHQKYAVFWEYRTFFKFFTLGNFLPPFDITRMKKWHHYSCHDYHLDFPGYSNYSLHKLQLVIWHRNLLQEHPDCQILFDP